MTGRRAAAAVAAEVVALAERRTEPFVTVRVAAYRTPGGGVHLSARFDGDDHDVHAHLPRIRSQMEAMRAAAELATSPLGKRLAAALRGGE